jgi:creatinine amidohydrolase/Fe(II)-dependent formamide hydrolase-like protein
MIEQKKMMSPLNLSRLTFVEVEKEINRQGTLIVPLGGCEPWGGFGTFGVASACAEALANALSQKMSLLCAPVFGTGCSTAFQSFGGTAGVKPRTFTNIFCETARMWFFQGFRAIVVIDSLTGNSEALTLAVKRLKSSHPDRAIIVFSFQQDSRVRVFIARYLPGQELGRTEYGMLSMAAWIDPGLVRKAEKENAPAIKTDAARFRQWQKRGADPEQFRKLFPDGSSSSIAAGFNADFGRLLFEYILKTLEENVASLIQETPLNRKPNAPSKNC